MLSGKESDMNARVMMSEIEAGGPKDGVRPGDPMSGRMRQFHDPGFPPNAPASLGQLSRLNEIDNNRWKCSAEINPESRVFLGGTDPDDVFQGRP